MYKVLKIVFVCHYLIDELNKWNHELRASFLLSLLFDIANISIKLHRSESSDIEWIPIEAILDKLYVNDLSTVRDYRKIIAHVSLPKYRSTDALVLRYFKRCFKKGRSLHSNILR